MSEMQSRIVEPASHDLISHDLTPQDIIRAFTTVCKMALDVIGGSRASQGESQRFLADMETLVAVVDGRPYQPRTRDKDALAELDDLDDILDRVFSKLCVEFGSKTDNLDELDNPINHVAWMKNCNAGCKVTIEELRQRFDRHPEESWQRFQ
jgi:hypothetical protein